MRKDTHMVWKNWTVLAGLCLTVAAAGAGCVAVQEPPSSTNTIMEETFPPNGTPYLGLLLQDEGGKDGAVVRWVYAGPLRPCGEKSALLARGDLLLAVDGKRVNVAELEAYVKSKKPGDSISLQARHTDADPNAAIATPGKGTKEDTIQIRVSAKENWCGPVEFAGPSITAEPASPFTGQTIAAISADDPLVKAGATAAAYIQRRVEQSGLREPVDKLLGLFKETLSEEPGANMLQVVRDSFLHPDRLLGNEAAIARSFKEAAADPRKAIPWAWVWNNGRGVPTQFLPGEPALSMLPEAVDLKDSATALDILISRCAAAQTLVDGALDKAYDLSPADPQLRQNLRARLDQLLQASMDMSLDDGDPRAMVDVMKRSTRVDFDRLYSAGHVLGGFMIKSAAPPQTAQTVALPAELNGAVTGTILAAKRSGANWYVYGGFGQNTYDMTRIAGVIDPGGGDTFNWPAGPTLPVVHAPSVQVIVAMGDHNTYTGSAAGGPGVGVLGVNLVVDYGGTSTFTGADMSAGVGFLGIGMVVCHAGDNRFEGKGWTQGAGYYGFGAIVNLGANRNDYIAQQYSQGIGGPRGIGLIIDRGSNNFYMVDGPVLSAYGMTGSRYAMSQGIGYGVRGYDSGGLGMILNLGAEAHYVGGEFSQGGGYYWGLGIIHNAGSRNTFQGNRYCQGFGCHQALGIVDNEGGGNSFWSTIAASQGAAWDISTGILIDRQGGNSYSGGDISQGSAAMQSIGWMISLAGPNQYRAAANAMQGKSGSNSYSFKKTGCYSFSVLLDAEGDRSLYGRGAVNGQTMMMGEKNDAKPEESSLHGLFISVPGKIDWDK